jgi:hypothetical protein
LTADLIVPATADFAAISIYADDVVVDLNGHTIDNLGAGPATTVIGVVAYKRRNVTIKNGTLVGFWSGIHLDDDGPQPYTASQGHRIEGVRIDRSTSDGIVVMGRNIVVRGNHVLATGGTEGGTGITVVGTGHRVIDNDITDVTTGPLIGTAIAVSHGRDALIVNNRISWSSLGVVYRKVGTDISTGTYRDNLTNFVASAYLGGTNGGNNN